MTKSQRSALGATLVALLHFASGSLVTIWDWVFWTMGMVGIFLFVFGEQHGK